MKKALFFTFSFGLVYFAKSATIAPTGSNLKWSLTSSWKDGIKPQAGDEVTIPVGRSMILDQDVDVKYISVLGSLIVDVTKNINIRTEFIMVMGNGALFQWGLQTNPYKMKGSITLVGSNPAAIIPGHGVSSKAILVMNGGVLQLHGEDKKSWTQLGATASKGDLTIVLKEPVTWKKEDSLVVASTDFDMNEAEMVKILTISPDGKTINLTKPLNYTHFGVLQNYTHGSDASIKWVLDERAEVGLLSKSITIQGDKSSKSNGFGGHIMIMDASKAYLSNVELRLMGQRGVKGRYPFHWHGVQNAIGQYIKNSSIHHTFNRAITVHATNDVLVESNVAYDNLGHAFFMEDGTEEGVKMLNNLGLVTRRPVKPYATLSSDTTNGRNHSGPSTFWITNPRNNINGNHAAGSDGSGIWYAPFNSPNGMNYNKAYNPLTFALPNGFIDNNVMHSSRHGFILGVGPALGDPKLEIPHENLGIDPPAFSKPLLKNIVVFKNSLGAYTRSRPGGDKEIYYENFIIADNRVGDAATWRTFYDKTLWVISSANYSKNYVPGTEVGGDVTAAHIVYDGPVITSNSHFSGTPQPGQSIFDQWGANIKFTGHSFENTTTTPGSLLFNYRNSTTDRVNPVWFLASVRDIDGKLTGVANTSITKSHPYLMDATSKLLPTNGAQSFIKFGYVEGIASDHPEPDEKNAAFPRPNASMIRSDGPQYSDKNAIEGYPITTILNKGLSTRLVLKKQIPARLRLDVYSMDPNDEFIIEYPNSPSTIKIYIGDALRYNEGQNFSTAINQIANPSLATLKATTATGVSWFWKDGTVYVKYKAPAGLDFTSDKKVESIFLCLYGNCIDGANLPLVVSNFEKLDSRGQLLFNPAKVNSSVFSNTMNMDSYTLTKIGASDECVSYKLNLLTQNWENIKALNIEATGAMGSDVFFEYGLKSKSLISLGKMAGNAGITSFLLPTQSDKKDTVSAIVLRTCESSITTGSTQTINLKNIALGDATGTIATGIITDIEEIEEFENIDFQNISIYPNPSNDGIFNLSQSANWKVSSILGKDLMSGNGGQVNLSGYPKGVYLIKINDKVERVVVE